jgi:hypothetical protein
VRHLNSEVRQQQLEWRRSQVLELMSEGYSQRKIAQKLQIDKSAVNRDILFLKKQARENLQYHIQDRIPMEYQSCMTGMKRNLKQTLEIAESAADPRVKLQARAIVVDCYKYIMEMTTGDVIITDAIRYVQGRMDHLNNQEKKGLKDIKDKEGSTADNLETTNGVF